MDQAVRYHTVLLGINHRSCPGELRDQLGFQASEINSVALSLAEIPLITEHLVLSTCNRTEIYVCSQNPEMVIDELKKWWSEYKSVKLSDIETHSYSFVHGEVPKHLFRVTSSLDSLVLGEDQILKQVKEAYKKSMEIGSAGPYLNHLFQQGISVGKLVRTTTGINEGAVSISFAAVQLCQKIWNNMDGLTAAIVGAGEMAILALKHLKGAGVEKFIFFNRSLENAEYLRQISGGEIFALDELSEKIADADIVISSTAAPSLVIKKEGVEKNLLKNRKQRIWVDIAAPRDIDSEIEKIPDNFVFSIDDLKAVVSDNQGKRENSAIAAENLVEEKVNEFKDWYLALDVVPVIRAIRDNAHDVVETEISRLLGRVSPKEKELIEEFGHRVIAKLMHAPTTFLREMGTHGEVENELKLVRRLFALDHKR